ncbi:MAG: ion channel [Bacteroidales bacterium]
MSLFTKFRSNANILSILVIIYGLFVVLFEFFGKPEPSVIELINDTDFFINIIMIITFGWLFYHAKNKRKFMKTGWLFLLAAIPSVGPLANIYDYMQIFRIVVLSLILTSDTMNEFERKRNIESNLFFAGMVIILIMLICVILVLHFENVPQGNIKTAFQAIYWAVTTVTTVGYGDFYPVTTGGQIVTMILIICGISFIIPAFSYVGLLLKNPYKKNNEDHQKTNILD